MQTTDQAVAAMIALTEARVKQEAADFNNRLRYSIADMRRALDLAERDLLSNEKLAEMSGDDAWRHLRNVSYAFTRMAHVPAGERAKEAADKADDYSKMIQPLRHIAAAE